MQHQLGCKTIDGAVVGGELTTALADRICSWDQRSKNADVGYLFRSKLQKHHEFRIIQGTGDINNWLRAYFYSIKSKRMRAGIRTKCFILSKICGTLLSKYNFATFVSQHKFVDAKCYLHRAVFGKVPDVTRFGLTTFRYAPVSFKWDLLQPVLDRNDGVLLDGYNDPFESDSSVGWLD